MESKSKQPSENSVALLNHFWRRSDLVLSESDIYVQESQKPKKKWRDGGSVWKDADTGLIPSDLLTHIQNECQRSLNREEYWGWKFFFVVGINY